MYVLILANTGIRVGEARGLRWSDVSSTRTLTDEIRSVLTVRGKTGEREVVCNIGVDKFLSELKSFRTEELGAIPRVLVVDIALGIGRAAEKDLLHVTQFIRFVLLDGVPWDDAEKKSQLYVGTAMNDFVDRTRSDSLEELKPTIKETVPRVLRSAAMRMHDNNLIAIPRSVGNEGTPIIINNACVSWHRLAGDFMFGGARGYVGTLFPISTTEAEEVLLRALGKNYGKMIPHAFWSAQREVYGDGPRRPYVVAGIYTQRIRATPADTPAYITKELQRGRDSWTEYRDHRGPHDAQRSRTVDAHIAFFEREVRWFRQQYGK